MNSANANWPVQCPGDIRSIFHLSRNDDAIRAYRGISDNDQVKPPENRVKLGINVRGGFKDFLDARMRATDHENYSLGRADYHRKLIHLPRSGSVGERGEQEKARKNFSRLPDLNQIRSWPGCRPTLPWRKIDRWISTEVMHVFGN